MPVRAPGHHKTVLFSYAAVVILFFRRMQRMNSLYSHKPVIDKVRDDIVPLDRAWMSDHRHTAVGADQFDGLERCYSELGHIGGPVKTDITDKRLGVSVDELFGKKRFGDMRTSDRCAVSDFQNGVEADVEPKTVEALDNFFGASGVGTLAVVCGVALTAALLAATLTHVWTPFCFTPVFHV